MLKKTPFKLEIHGQCHSCNVGKSCLLRGFNLNEIKQFEQIIEKQIFLEKKAILIEPGQANSSLYVIKSGTLKSYNMLKEGEEEIRTIYSVGDIVGIEFLKYGIYPSFVESLEPTIICQIPYHKLQLLLTTVPQLQKNIQTIIYHSQDKTQDLIKLLRDKKALTRYARYLLLLMKQNEHRNLPKTILRPSLSRRTLANYLHLSKETISRVTTKLRKKGIIQVQFNTIVIKNVDALLKITQSSSKEIKMNISSK